MKHPNYSNKVLKKYNGKLVEIPGFSGYFVDLENNIFSCAGAEVKKVVVWHDRTSAGYPRKRVHLHNDIGKGRNMSYKKVLKLALGQEVYEQRMALEELF